MGAPLTMSRAPRMENGTVILVSNGTASSLFRIELEFDDEEEEVELVLASVLLRLLLTSEVVVFVVVEF
jgi:hypothetical protein